MPLLTVPSEVGPNLRGHELCGRGVSELVPAYLAGRHVAQRLEPRIRKGGLKYLGGRNLSEEDAMTRKYDELLARAQSTLEKTAHKSTQERLEIPEPQVIWVGNKTILRNYSEYPKLMRRDPDRLLMYLAKELATAASLDGDRAIFIGRKDKTSFQQLFQRYMQDNVTCPVCGSPDTHIVTESRLHFRVCEACGARSSARVN